MGEKTSGQRRKIWPIGSMYGLSPYKMNETWVSMVNPIRISCIFIPSTINHSCTGKYADNTLILWLLKRSLVYHDRSVQDQLSRRLMISQGTDSLVEHVPPSLLGHRRNRPGTHDESWPYSPRYPGPRIWTPKKIYLKTGSTWMSRVKLKTVPKETVFV